MTEVTITRLEHEGHDISFDPFFNIPSDVDTNVDTLSVQENTNHVNLEWNNLSFYVPSKNQQTSEDPFADHLRPAGKHTQSSQPQRFRRWTTRAILRGVSGHVQTGQILAIMGASGAGKTSLLNILAGRVTSSPGATIRGSVIVNTSPRDYKTFKKLAAYVLQEDDMFGELTIREHLMYTARLRLPASIDMHHKKLRVEKIIQELGLMKVADTKIGDPTIRGISGGERKRLSIATELVADASLIFLDEPTSGLDSFNALTVMKTLRRLASCGRTIVTTIHQPRSSIFQLFDMLLLLSEGRTVYFGPAKDAIPYFASLHFPPPESFNPADFFVDLISMDSRSKERELNTKARIDYLSEKYAASEHDVVTTRPMQAQTQFASDRTGMNTVSLHSFERGWVTEFRILASRTARVASRARIVNYVRLFQTSFFAVVLSIIWASNGRSSEFGRRNSLTGLMFFMCINQSFMGVFSNIFDYPRERSIVNRERGTASYRTSSYYLAKFLTELPRTAFFVLTYLLLVYLIVGLRPGFGNFCRFYVTSLGCALFGESLGITASILTGNAQASAALCPTIVVISILFGGFFIQDSQIPDWIRWIKHVSFVFYGFNAFAKVEYAGYALGEKILSQRGFNSWTYWSNLGLLYLVVTVVRLIGFLALAFCRAPRFLTF